jgi:hypothetical protein
MDVWLTERQIEEKVVGLVGWARQQCQIPFGCSAESACQKVGLQVCRGPLPAGTDGALSGERILLNESITWRPRIEFTIFHEIVHYLLDEDGELINFFTEALRRSQAAYDAAIERCCHLGAAEFLMPRDQVRETIGEKGLSVELVELVADGSGASLVAAAIQLAACSPADCYVLLCCFGPIPKAWPPRTGLHIEYAATPCGIKYPLARFTPLPADHLLTTAWQNRCYANDRSYVPFRSGRRMPCYCEAKYVNGRVLGVLTFAPPTPREQLLLF